MCAGLVRRLAVSWCEKAIVTAGWLLAGCWLAAAYTGVPTLQAEIHRVSCFFAAGFHAGGQTLERRCRLIVCLSDTPPSLRRRKAAYCCYCRHM